MLSTLAHLFTPRHSNNHRPRLLHFPGLTILIAIVLLSNASVSLVKAPPPRGVILGYASNITASQVLEATNEQRLKLGLPALKLNPSLSEAAQNKAAHMFANNYWAHTAPDGSTPWDFIKGTGYRYSVAGENLARDFDDTPSMVEAWMNSPTHRANIVHPKYTEAGIAVVNGKLDGIETTLVVNMFGLPTSAALTPTSPQLTAAATSPSVQTTPRLEPSVLANTQNQNSAQIYVSPLELKQSLSLSLVGLLLAVFAVDEIIVRNRKTIRLVGKNLAHMGFLAALFIIIFSLRQGGIL